MSQVGRSLPLTANEQQGKIMAWMGHASVGVRVGAGTRTCLEGVQETLGGQGVGTGNSSEDLC